MSKKIIYDFRAGPAPNQDTTQPQRLEWYLGEPAYLFSQREGYNDEAETTETEEEEEIEETLAELVAFEKYQNNGH
jgi:hypothetical protein